MFGKWLAITLVSLSTVLSAPLSATAEEPQEQPEPESEETQEEPEPEPWTVKWSNGFKVEQGDSFKLKFGGRIQADYHFASADNALETAFDPTDFENGFEFRRARLFFEGTIYDRVKFKAQYDFAGSNANFRDVWIGLEQSFGEVRFGHYKEYFSLEELTSSKYIAFAERSLPILAFSPSYNSGVGVQGSNGDKLNWGIGYFYDVAADAVSSGNEDRANLTGRIAYRPIFQDGGKRMLHVGLGINHRGVEDGGTLRFRSRPEQHLTTRLIDTGSFAADGATIVGLEVAGVQDRFWFAGEYVQNEVDAPEFGDPTFDGYYLQAGYFLTKNDYRRFKGSSGGFDRQKPSNPWDKSGGRGAWEVAVRFSNLNLNDAAINGGEEDNVTLALNWYPNPATRFMLNYVLADVAGLGDANFVIARWQVDF